MALDPSSYTPAQVEAELLRYIGLRGARRRIFERWSALWTIAANLRLLMDVAR